MNRRRAIHKYAPDNRLGIYADQECAQLLVILPAMGATYCLSSHDYDSNGMPAISETSVSQLRTIIQYYLGFSQEFIRSDHPNQEMHNHIVQYRAALTKLLAKLDGRPEITHIWGSWEDDV